MTPSLSIYDFFAHIIPGAYLGAVSYFAIEGDLPTISAVAAIPLLIAAFIAGHVIQWIGSVSEDRLWKILDDDYPSRRLVRDKAGAPHLAPELISLVDAKFVLRFPGCAQLAIDSDERFDLIRCDLRLRSSDRRPEELNATYVLMRGLIVSSVGIALVAAGEFAFGDSLRALAFIAGAAGAAYIFAMCAKRFGYLFARQVWMDFAASED